MAFQRNCMVDHSVIIILLSMAISVGLPCIINPFAPGDFAEKHVLKLVEWFSGHYRAIKS